ncbi:hypothetical protein AA313_de0207108 [Arthrobotrys entomopaga]|nr:hypothetical protein AA313_de0207108 [Arthrobotrys entomopaga]
MRVYGGHTYAVRGAEQDRSVQWAYVSMNRYRTGIERARAGKCPEVVRDLEGYREFQLERKRERTPPRVPSFVDLGGECTAGVRELDMSQKKKERVKDHHGYGFPKFRGESRESLEM